ncbi:MAG: glutamine-hydrolyzing carbamoyl-phosphate synthase small subunit [Phycisphaerales bacterium]
MSSANHAVIGRLALEDGTVFVGRAFGACSDETGAGGEVVFNTAMCGYQEALTDPSYTGQILVMTAPEMGNYGISKEDVESASVAVKGFVVRELVRTPSNHRAEIGLSEWLAAAGVCGLEGIDTRALVRILRSQGALRGIVWSGSGRTDQELVEMARALPSMNGQNLAGAVSPHESSRWREGLGTWTLRGQPRAGGTFKVVALDCGAKSNIYRNLTERGCEIEVVPHDFTAAEIRARRPDGLFISNGPGDPAAVEKTIATLREIAGEVPTFGICLGHQLLALALGARTWKLKFGHRGANQPVRNLLTGRVEITSQNHGFCVDEESLRAVGGEPTHVHLNDGTLAGFRHTTRPIFSVQYHPEASPGPHDSAYLFDCFVTMMQTRRPITAADMEAAQKALAAV